MSTTPDKDITLHYIDKTIDALKETDKFMNRSFIAMIIISLILITISAGIVSVDKSVSINGFSLSAPSSLLLVLGIWTIEALLVYLFSFSNRALSLESTLIRLYNSIGYTDESMSD